MDAKVNVEESWGGHTDGWLEYMNKLYNYKTIQYSEQLLRKGLKHGQNKRMSLKSSQVHKKGSKHIQDIRSKNGFEN